MIGLNDCTFVGRLGKKPETKTTQGGNTWGTFTMAVDKNRKSDDKDDKPLWLNVTVFGKTAEFTGKYLDKGALVLVKGELEVEQYTDNNQQPRTAVKILANRVISLEKGSGAAASNGDGKTAAQPAPAATAPVTADDIPF